ncbi:hypothetical protein [Pedobacter sp. Leaf216]|nr:hypothetical protein [Pedobacter sp. Leaf216]
MNGQLNRELLLYEPAGEAHTLVVNPGEVTPAIILFMATGGAYILTK